MSGLNLTKFSIRTKYSNPYQELSVIDWLESSAIAEVKYLCGEEKGIEYPRPYEFLCCWPYIIRQSIESYLYEGPNCIGRIISDSSHSGNYLLEYHSLSRVVRYIHGGIFMVDCNLKDGSGGVRVYREAGREIIDRQPIDNFFNKAQYKSEQSLLRDSGYLLYKYGLLKSEIEKEFVSKWTKLFGGHETEF